MKRLISSKEALEVLSTRAPQAWCKRLLLSLIMDGTVTAYACDGHLTARVPVSCLLDDENLVRSDGEPFWAAVREKWGPGAPTEAEIFQGYKFPVTGYRWHEENNEPTAIGYGYFAYANSLDWDAGTLRIDSIYPAEVERDLFLADDHMFVDGGNLAQPRFSWLEFEVEFSSISFHRSAIELLTGLDRVAPRANDRPGRPSKWDWTGAMTAVVCLANQPDGIGSERGEQSRVEEALATWFVDQTGNQPHTSQIRACAQRVMAALAEK